MKILQNKTFRFWAIQITLAVFLIGIIMYGSLKYLDSWTRHNEFIEVPDLNNIPFSEAQELLTKQELRYEVLDSAPYNPKIPKFAVVGQTPSPNEKVKRDRKIYLTLNPSNYQKVTIPRVIQVTYRSAEATLKAVGLSVGKITYVDNIGKDMVLKMFYKGKEIQPGEQLSKKSVIDLECGNGRDPLAPADFYLTDSINNDLEGIDI
ncbi:MAG: PASTA domain-containing protein [Capnocytophaga sp.]|nr:PASTA domain-containing protein [Capnocytophaga sp.]